jgi:hypothetical protein
MERPDRSTLQVKDQYGVTVLQAHDVNKRVVRMSAMVRFRNGGLVNLSMEPMVRDVCVDIGGVRLGPRGSTFNMPPLTEGGGVEPRPRQD